MRCTVGRLDAIDFLALEDLAVVGGNVRAEDVAALAVVGVDVGVSSPMCHACRQATLDWIVAGHGSCSPR